MSDTFDHWDDAFCNDWGPDEYDPRDYNDYDTNYHHHFVRYIEIEHHTEKALLIELKNGRCWIPKKLIRDHNHDKKSFYLWDGFKPKYLKEENIDDMFDEIEDEVVITPGATKPIEESTPDEDLDKMVDHWFGS